MKKHSFPVALLWGFLSLILGTTGCSDDKDWPEVDGQSPTMALVSDHIQSGAGHRFTIEGLLTDKDGIATVNLQCLDLYLDKTIDLIENYGTPKETYDLNYYFDLGKDEIGERFTVKVTVTDVGGRSVSQDVLITMDGDFASPVFTTAPDATLTVLIKAETKFNLNFSVSDDRELDYVLVDIPGVEGYENLRVDITAGQKAFQYSSKIIIPNEAKSYDIMLTVFDKKANSTVTTSTLNVSEMPDFPKMYLADVASVEELNSDVFGVPMVIERTAPYQYKANYYSRKAGTEIFFLPQKSDFAPICFGLDPEDSGKLTDDPETAKPIVLAEANIYYEITIDVQNSTYALKTYPISSATNRLPQPIGSDYMLDAGQPQFVVPFQIGVLGNLPGANGGPSGLLIFAQDATNPNLFYTEDFELESGEKLNFIIHNRHDWGWWDYCLWRLDNSDNPEKFIYGGADASPKPADVWGKPMVQKSGKYKFWFDAHLERGKIIPVK